MNTQKFTAVLETLQKQQTADVAAHDAAFARSGDGGVFVRRTMLFMAFAILGLCPFIFAFFEDIPVAVETLEQSGGWLWGLIPEKESFAVAYVKGFYLADVWKELMANLISEKRLDVLERTLFGNGHKGLKAELVELKTQIETFKRIAVWQIGILVAIFCAVLKNIW